MTRYTKDPDAKKDYGWDWSPFLGTDTISQSDWLINDMSLVDWAAQNPTPSFVAYDASNTTTTTTVWLRGGDSGLIYSVTNRITTTAGRIEDLTFRMRIRNQ